MRKLQLILLLLVAFIALETKPWIKPDTLEQAVCRSNIFWVGVYLARGDDVNGQQDDSNFNPTPLISALDTAGCPKPLPNLWARMLVFAGADVNRATKNGSTPLMMAVSEQNVAMVRFLLEKGARVEERTESGVSALDIASNLKNEELVKLLQGAPGP
ncbi:ankyrin repeat domain-containing protein [Rhizobium paknamense]|uniref:Ankyrin repeat protein n=1 Tax=Rhizobium paknamense TaxID=1206817 RepID=A0ABU0IJ88_9HYPH|nr:ankyrin repeat domain-containing protein [Rhizobium paknamense]MDQ0457311.1 ankyrin repeat protein [Rhizobium paknamense]